MKLAQKASSFQITYVPFDIFQDIQCDIVLVCFMVLYLIQNFFSHIYNIRIVPLLSAIQLLLWEVLLKDTTRKQLSLIPRPLYPESDAQSQTTPSDAIE